MLIGGSVNKRITYGYVKIPDEPRKLMTEQELWLIELKMKYKYSKDKKKQEKYKYLRL